MSRKGLSQPDAGALVRLRVQKGLTQEELALRARCSLRTIQRAETGSSVRVATLHDIAAALECSPADLEARVSSVEPALSGLRRPRAWRIAVAVVAAAITVLTGSVLISTFSSERQEVAAPVVADINGDGRDEIVIWDLSAHRWLVVDLDGRRLPVHADAADLDMAVQIFAAGDVYGYDSDQLIILQGRTKEWLAIDLVTRETSPIHNLEDASRVLVGDLDGDRLDDLITWRPSMSGWTAMTRDGELLFANRQFGRAGDEPLVGDFDGDGRDECATWRPFTGQWFARGLSSQSLFVAVDWGHPGDVPLVGDFDGDGRDDLAYWRPVDGEWAARQAPLADALEPAVLLFRGVHLGRRGDLPLVGDFDGDGRDDISVWTPSDRQWSGLTESGLTRFDVDLAKVMVDSGLP